MAPPAIPKNPSIRAKGVNPALCRLEGRNDGRLEGPKEGRKGGLRDGIDALCEAFGISLPATELMALRTSDVARLETIFAELRATRQWPGV